MRAVVVGAGAKPGDLPPLAWSEVDDPPPPGPGQLLLGVRATSVNRADLLQRAGRYPPPPGASPILGLEAAGEVLAVGAGVTSPRVGELVMALLAGGGYAERVLVDARHVLPIPRAVGLPAAGGCMETFLTAHLNLLDLGRLAKGERVLIHGGASGVGTSAIQLAREAGAAEVWVTAGSDERLARCRELGAAHGVNYRTDDFVARLRAAGGAHLILDVMGASYLARNVDALMVDGRLVVIGLQGGTKAELDLGKLLAKRAQVIGSTLRALSADRKADLVARARARTWPLLDEGRVRVVVDGVFPIAEVEAAHAALDRDHVGKVLLRIAD